VQTVTLVVITMRVFARIKMNHLDSRANRKSKTSGKKLKTKEWGTNEGQIGLNFPHL